MPTACSRYSQGAPRPPDPSGVRAQLRAELSTRWWPGCSVLLMWRQSRVRPGRRRPYRRDDGLFNTSSLAGRVASVAGFVSLTAIPSGGGVRSAGVDDLLVPHPASTRMPHVAASSLVNVIVILRKRLKTSSRGDSGATRHVSGIPDTTPYHAGSRIVVRSHRVVAARFLRTRPR